MSFDLAAAASIVQSIKDIKAIVDFLPLKNPILLKRDRLIELKDRVDNLEDKISSDLPRLAELIRSYSSVISEVKVAKTLSDKVSELIEAIPGDAVLIYTRIFINQLESSHGQISSGISQIRLLDVPEEGALTVKLEIIRDLIRDLKREDDPKNVKREFDNVSTQYTDMQRILSELLEKILKSFSSP